VIPEIYKHPQAREDLLAIWLYTFEHWGVEQADYYLGEIEAAIRRLAKNPSVSVDCSDILSGYRRLGVGRHHIYFRCDGDVIDIIRILHVRMDALPQLDG
jgi:toxin ParE1/3/4